MSDRHRPSNLIKPVGILPSRSAVAPVQRSALIEGSCEWSMVGFVIQAAGTAELENGLKGGNQSEAENGRQRIHTT